MIIKKRKLDKIIIMVYKRDKVDKKTLSKLNFNHVLKKKIPTLDLGFKFCVVVEKTFKTNAYFKQKIIDV